MCVCDGGEGCPFASVLGIFRFPPKCVGGCAQQHAPVLLHRLQVCGRVDQLYVTLIAGVYVEEGDGDRNSVGKRVKMSSRKQLQLFFFVIRFDVI